jgi:hypothetical protein
MSLVVGALTLWGAVAVKVGQLTVVERTKHEDGGVWVTRTASST